MRLLRRLMNHSFWPTSATLRAPLITIVNGTEWTCSANLTYIGQFCPIKLQKQGLLITHFAILFSYPHFQIRDGSHCGPCSHLGSKCPADAILTGYKDRCNNDLGPSNSIVAKLCMQTASLFILISIVIMAKAVLLNSPTFVPLPRALRSGTPRNRHTSCVQFFSCQIKLLKSFVS